MSMGCTTPWDTARGAGVAGNPLDAIGHTPLVPLRRLTAGLSARVLVKLEYVNPTGSYKDRMALAMIEGAERRGEIVPGRTTVVEYTGGSTGPALALICAVKGLPLKIVTSDAFSAEKARMVAAFGAEVDVVPSADGTITPDLMPRLIQRARELARRRDTYWVNQFHNPDNAVGQRAMGREILAQTGGLVDAFVVSVGTGGCAMGVGWVMRESAPQTRLYIVEPATSPVISGGPPGNHRVEGISSGFVPPLLDRRFYDHVLLVDEEEARQTARLLAVEEGIFAGTSTGMNVAAALRVAREMGAGATVVTPAVDSGLRYLSTDLFSS